MNITYIIDWTDKIIEAKEKKTLNKPFRTPKGPKKFSVYVKNEKGNVVKVNFGDPNMEIKRDDPKRRASFRARHKCDSPGPKWKARYWSCKQWRAGTKVEGSEVEYEWDGETLFNQNELIEIHPALAFAEDSNEEERGDCGCGNGCADNECGCGNCGCNNEETEEGEASLWENIRKKKKRMGKNYKPAKPGDKDYPKEEALKKAQKKSKK